MKWSIAFLLLLGVGAAISASILVASLKIVPSATASAPAAPTEVQIVVASKQLSAMNIVDGRSVEVKTVPIKEAPKNYLSQPTDVVGKLLIVPVVEGQPFSTSCFADEKSGARLASALKNGMRAVSLSLKPEKAGLLYPGCIVDVLFSLNRPSTEGTSVKEAMSMTLLQGIEVLAIDDMSVMSEEALAEPSAPETSTPIKRDRKDRLITLMVNSTQAKALQLASQYGGISLALRNPLDSHPVETDSTMLSDLADEYTRIVAALQPASAAAATPTTPTTQTPAQDSNMGPTVGPVSNGHSGITKAELAAALAEHEARKAEAPPQKVEDPKCDVLVNRSGQLELVRFRRESTISPTGIKEGLQWIWDGRAMPGAQGAGN